MQLLTIPEACGRLRVSRGKLYGLFREGSLPIKKIGRRTLVADADIDALIRTLPGRDGAEPARSR